METVWPGGAFEEYDASAFQRTRFSALAETLKNPAGHLGPIPMRAWMALLFLGTALAGCIGTDGGPGADDQLDPNALPGPGGFSDTAVFPGDYDLDGDWSRVLDPGAFDILEPRIETLASDVDGAQLQVGYFLPDVPEGTEVPVVVFASPYIFNGMTAEGLKNDFMYEPLVPNFVPHGYAVAFVPIRGTADNGGCMDLMGPKERADLDQAVTWLGEAPWSNGNIGMVGVSYDGSTPWMVASMGNPHLKTIVPISGVPDWFTLMFHNGTNEVRGPGALNAVYYSFGFAQYNAVAGTRSPQHMAEGVACPASWAGLGAAAYSGVTGERDPTGFWAERDSRPGVEANYEGSILLVQGLVDWNVDPHNAYPWVNHLEDQGLVVKHLLGQWPHAAPDWGYEGGELTHWRMDWAETLLHWWDYWLKEETTVDLGPKAQVQDSSGQWRNEASWPPDDAVRTTFYVSPGNALDQAVPTSTEPVPVGPSTAPYFTGSAFDVYPGCAVCPSFTTAPFEDEFRFAGIPQVHVTVTPAGPTGHLAAWLYVVDGGERERVGWGQIDLRFAAGDTETMSPVVPGQPVVARMVLEPLDVVVPAGAHLELQFLQGSYGDHAPSAGSAPLTVEAGPDSTFTVHAFERGPEVFFDPPSA